MTSLTLLLGMGCGGPQAPETLAGSSAGGSVDAKATAAGQGASQGGASVAKASSVARAPSSAAGGVAGMAGVAGSAHGAGGHADADQASAAGSGGAAAASGSSATSGSNAGNGGAAVQSAASGCTRTLLRSSVDAYFTALAAHDPSTLPLADRVKFTENGEVLELGKAGLWKSAGALRHAHSALDVDACSSVTQAVVPDGGTDIPLALRLKIEQQKITEIESIAVRAGDYMLASNTAALSASAMTVHWEEPVASDQRSAREQLVAWMTKYFRMFPRGVCNTTNDCKRIENGGGSFSCSAGASCATDAPGPNDHALEPRLILADVEAGLGVGFTMFQSNTDVHMFKMYGGKVYGVSAILGEASSSGW